MARNRRDSANGSSKLLADAGDAGNVEVLMIEDLRIDALYQRDLSQDLVNKIAETWDLAAAGPIVVSRRKSGDMYIVNGQHRTAAAKRAGETEILAQVIEGLDAKTEAELRLKGNTRRSDRPAERFKAQVAAGHEDSLAIVEICNRFDTKINEFPNMSSGINAVAAIERLYERDNGILLVRTFEMIQDAWSSVGGEYATSSILKSLAFFINQHPEANRNRLIGRLTMEGPKGLQRRGMNHRAIHGGAEWLNYYRALVEVYNDKLNDANKLELRTGGWSVYAGGGGGWDDH